MRKVVVLLRAGSMSWGVDGVYDSIEDLLDHKRKDWGDPDLTIDDLLEEGDYQIEYGDYYINKATIREEKIDDIING